MIKKSLTALILGGIFLGFTGLEILRDVVMHAGLGNYLIPFLWSSFPQIVINALAAYLVLSRWDRMRSWQRTALAALGVQSVILFLNGFVYQSLTFGQPERTHAALIYLLSFNVYTIFSPLEIIYRHFVTHYDPEWGMKFIYDWEHALLTLLRYGYALFVGAVIDKLTDRIMNIRKN